MFRQKIVKSTYDILKSINITIWGGVESAEKVGNIPATKLYPTSVCCRTVRIYCQRDRTFWGCTSVVGEGIKKYVKFKVDSK
jgi:hypothetical protein